MNKNTRAFKPKANTPSQNSLSKLLSEYHLIKIEKIIATIHKNNKKNI